VYFRNSGRSLDAADEVVQFLLEISERFVLRGNNDKAIFLFGNDLEAEVMPQVVYIENRVNLQQEWNAFVNMRETGGRSGIPLGSPVLVGCGRVNFDDCDHLDFVDAVIVAVG
jgi:hypothetical protein